MVDVKTKYNDVMTALREEIVSGVYGPGHRLPTRSEMGVKFGVGMATVQKALTTLEEEGFVNARASSGTFVAERLPHLCNYAITMPQATMWSCFCASMKKAIQVEGRGENIRFLEYTTSREVGERGDVVQLCKDVRRRRLAGIIMIGNPSDLENTPAMDEPGIARVSLQNAWPVSCPTTSLGQSSFFDRSLEYLQSRGCRRIAHLSMYFPARENEIFEEEVRRRSIETRPYWFQNVPMERHMSRTVEKIVNLLMHLKGDDRPDGLVLHDDNFIEAAVAGLMTAGVKVPDDLQIVSKCNYPLLQHAPLPITMLGMDCRAALRTCLNVIDELNHGRTPPKYIPLPAMFEDEVSE